MENHSLVDGAVQMVGDAANFFGQKVLVPAALSVATALSSPAGAAELAPVASQVMAVEVAVSTLKGLGLSKKKMKQFQALSPENQSAAMFFYHGLKTGNAEFQKEGMTKIIRLLAFKEENEKAVIEMKKAPNILKGISAVDTSIAELSDPKTYGAIFTSPQSPYSARFLTIKTAAEQGYSEAKTLQAKAENTESPELVAAKKREADSAAALAASRNELAASRDRLATSRATLQTLQQINQSFAGK